MFYANFCKNLLMLNLLHFLVDPGRDFFAKLKNV